MKFFPKNLFYNFFNGQESNKFNLTQSFRWSQADMGLHTLMEP